MTESETYDLFQRGRAHLKRGMPAQATVSLEKAKRREPEKASHYGLARALEKLGRTSEARGHLKLARSLRPDSEHYAERLRAIE